jgi:ATP-dependent Lhr-like helicase
VGPLKALINDQFNRLDRLCEKLEIPVHRWHGDVSASHKQAVRRDPAGILLITPESLESNFINYGSQVPRLYRDLEFVVIDELHSFLGNVRGIHLLSLLSRLKFATKRQPRLIGLSATLGDPEFGKRFLASVAPGETQLIQDSGNRREIRYALKAVIKHPDSPRGGNRVARVTTYRAGWKAMARKRDRCVGQNSLGNPSKGGKGSNVFRQWRESSQPSCPGDENGFDE